MQSPRKKSFSLFVQMVLLIRLREDPGSEAWYKIVAWGDHDHDIAVHLNEELPLCLFTSDTSKSLYSLSKLLPVALSVRNNSQENPLPAKPAIHRMEDVFTGRVEA
jgi:hypothetical protein